jgi:protein PhnA
MSLNIQLADRANNHCELCNATENLIAYPVPPRASDEIDNQIVTCVKCNQQLTSGEDLDANHLRCLNESIWSEVPAVQVVAYRLLDQLGFDWATDLKNMMYMEDSTREWAESASGSIIHKDSNGNVLQTGDTVTLIQDLNVKGANFTAKRGTAVRRIRLVHDNAEHIEGKIDGQHIVILTKYVKK